MDISKLRLTQSSLAGSGAELGNYNLLCKQDIQALRFGTADIIFPYHYHYHYISYTSSNLQTKQSSTTLKTNPNNTQKKTSHILTPPQTALNILNQPQNIPHNHSQPFANTLSIIFRGEEIYIYGGLIIVNF